MHIAFNSKITIGTIVKQQNAKMNVITNRFDVMVILYQSGIKSQALLEFIPLAPRLREHKGQLVHQNVIGNIRRQTAVFNPSIILDFVEAGLAASRFDFVGEHNVKSAEKVHKIEQAIDRALPMILRLILVRVSERNVNCGGHGATTIGGSADAVDVLPSNRTLGVLTLGVNLRLAVNLANGGVIQSGAENCVAGLC